MPIRSLPDGSISLPLRQWHGSPGFPAFESEHDHFGAGHSSTAISAAAGMAIARDLKGEDYSVVAVVGTEH